MPPNQDVVWFDVAVKDVLIMGVLESWNDFFEVLDDGGQRYLAAFGMTRTHRATRGVIEHKKGHSVLYIEVEQTHNVGVHEPLGCLGLLLKLLLIHIAQIQDLDGCLFGRQSDMLTQVDAGKSACAEATYQTIVAKLLTSEILSEGHFYLLINKCQSNGQGDSAYMETFIPIDNC